MPRPPLPTVRTVARRLRAAGTWLLVMLAGAAILPSVQPLAGGRQQLELLMADLGVNGVPSPAEWARLRYEAWLRGRAAAAEAAAAQAAAEAAASGPGAAAPPVSILPDGSGSAIPALALRAYQQAAAWASGFDPGCHLSWTVLAGIGRIESNHGLHFGAATRFSPDGLVSPVITGPPLDGSSGARIGDTDGGRWDGDTTWDRAVGPMQFLPSTWRALGRDGSGDDIADPNNFFDATVSAAAYLCLNAGDTREQAQLRGAVYAYNHSWSYVDAVLRWAALYAGGVSVGPPVTSAPPPPSSPPILAAPTTRPRASGGATSTTGRATSPPTSGTTTTTRAATTTSTTTTTLPPTSGTTTTTSAPTTTAPCVPPTTDPGSTTTTTTTTTTLPEETTTTLPPCQ
jgi:membrane-bound lytic murein transglycosylase B